MKKILSIVTVITLCFSLCIPAYAQSDDMIKKETVIYETTPEERDAIFEKYMEEYNRNLENNNIETRGLKYKFKTDYLPVSFHWARGFAGNQQRDGYRFPTGGGFWYSEAGGPTVNGSVSISLPAPFDTVSFSMNLGNKSSSGLFVEVPDTKYSYKLYIERKFEVRPYATYRARVGSEDWELYDSGAVAVSVQIASSAKRVD